ncbi:prolyl oligopeptidase family serine peptidase, partial [bacterium]|nr:prolyl oligopeptidase family serine peptidase [bacterium]
MHLFKRLVFIMIMICTTAYNQTAYDLFLPASDEWAALDRNYDLTTDHPLIQPASFLHGAVPDSQRQRRNAGPFSFQVDYPIAGEFVIFVKTVSASGPLIVRIDGDIAAKFDLPAGANIGVESHYLEEHHLWRTSYHKKLQVLVSAGKHIIELENQGPDWISFAYFVLTRYSTHSFSPEYDRWKIYEKTIETLPQRLDEYEHAVTEWLEKLSTAKKNTTLGPTLKLQFENLQQLAKDFQPVDFDLMRTESELQELLNYLELHRDYCVEKHGRVKLAYCSEIDNALQPYDVIVPENYDSAKKYGLLVNLHGYSPSIHKWSSFFQTDTDLTLDSLGLLQVAVYGRRNRYYLGAGEQDVLAVMADIQRHFSIDENRIYLAGDSMGGYGAWAIGLHFPDLFAAISPVCGPTDFQNLAKVHAPKSTNKLLLASVSPVNFVQNARYLPARIYHGEIDPVVPVSQSRQIVRHLRGMNFPYEYNELPGLGHDVQIPVAADTQRLPWLLNFSRRTFQRRLVQRTFYLKYGKNRYLEITGKKNWDEFTQIKTELFPPNVIQVQTQNVASFQLYLSFFSNMAEYSVDVDGHVFYLSSEDITPEFTLDPVAGWKRKTTDSDGLVKKSGLEGPWMDGETGPF